MIAATSTSVLTIARGGFGSAKQKETADDHHRDSQPCRKPTDGGAKRAGSLAGLADSAGTARVCHRVRLEHFPGIVNPSGPWGRGASVRDPTLGRMFKKPFAVNTWIGVEAAVPAARGEKDVADRSKHPAAGNFPAPVARGTRASTLRGEGGRFPSRQRPHHSVTSSEVEEACPFCLWERRIICRSGARSLARKKISRTPNLFLSPGGEG